MHTDFDILIVGAGLVGSALACALSGRGLKLGLVEASDLQASAPPGHDGRNLALARATVLALDRLGVWSRIVTRVPIRRVHVSSQGQFGAARIDAERYAVDALGWVLPARELGAALIARLRELPDLHLICPARVEATQPLGERRELRLADGRRLSARLLAAADGTESTLRGLLGIEVERSDYGQSAIVGTLDCERDPRGCAYERFTEQGPVALLPMGPGRCGYIWTLPGQAATDLMARPEADFLAGLQQAFGYRLGRLERLGSRQAYPLARVLARRLTAERAVLIGNAAQTVHPIAAQGFNLGLRDAASLAECVERAAEDPGAAALLDAYAEWRREDRAGTLGFSDGLLRAFTNPNPLVRGLRALGLIAVDRIAALNARVARAGMGYRGRSPRLVCEAHP